MRFRMILTALGAASVLALAGCGNDSAPVASTSSASGAASSAPIGAPATHPGGQPGTTAGQGGHGGAGGSTHTTTQAKPAAAGSWDGNGNPVNGGPKGADGSTGNNLTRKYCAQNQDPGCPAGSYVAPNAIPNPNGDGSYVPCEGTICTNPNHGAGTDPKGNGGDSGAVPPPTTTKAPAPTTTQRDDDPGGKPCTTGMGVAGTYIWSDDSNEWVCQIG